MFIKLKELDKQLNNELEIYNRTSESRRITMAASLSEHYTIQLMLMAPMLNIDVSYILLYLKVLRLPTSRPDPEASSSSPGSRARASVLGIGLSAYMFDVGSDSIFKDIEKQKVEYQIPRKEVDVAAQGKDSHRFFSDQGVFCTGMPVQDLVPLEEREDSSRGRKEKDVFAPIRSMLQWDLSKRSTAKELAEDEWLKQYL
ncbi:hypothetical protein PENANT_c010G01178 [Penicillium antarcticum]|uniref:Protein kinase domain-containing protein n=1 Tax=Penicillium antarcticum TaxID=416450 RepID=A0A1V6Q7Q1_9EURO|nr:hypothetical protein PENANT_c010G01178 [Penicillium antarcticum]